MPPPWLADLLGAILGLAVILLVPMSWAWAIMYGVIPIVKKTEKKKLPKAVSAKAVPKPKPKKSANVIDDYSPEY